jgi:hypothetical protein
MNSQVLVLDLHRYDFDPKPISANDFLVQRLKEIKLM